MSKKKKKKTSSQCWLLTLCLQSFYSQCALAALNDVRQYLSVEGGQVAVSSCSCPSVLHVKLS